MAALTRRNTKFYSNQAFEGTCTNHVFCKLLLKNVVELFYPLPIEDDIYVTNYCNRYLNTQHVELTTLTPEECTRNGYLRIILFHYFYSLYARRPRGYNLLNIDIVKPCIEIMFIPEHVTHKTEIREILHIVNNAKILLGIQYNVIVVDTKEGILNIIWKILSLGFYIGVSLTDNISEGPHIYHAVHIVDVYETEDENGFIIDRGIIFKNSWGDERLYKMNVFDTGFKLGPYSFHIAYFVFYLPCNHENKGWYDDEHFKDGDDIVNDDNMDAFTAWIDDYETNFFEMMKGLPKILASIPAMPAVYEPSVKPSAASCAFGGGKSRRRRNRKRIR